MNPLLKAFAPINALPHIYQIVGVFVAGASVFLACYGLSAKGLLDIAATALAYFIVQLLALMGPSFVRRAPKEFAQSASMIDTFLIEFTEWRTNQKLLAKGLLALGATIIFLTFRFVAATVLPLIASPWFAGAIGLAVTACVISPVLVRGLVQTFKTNAPSTTGVTDD